MKGGEKNEHSLKKLVKEMAIENDKLKAQKEMKTKCEDLQEQNAENPQQSEISQLQKEIEDQDAKI